MIPAMPLMPYMPAWMLRGVYRGLDRAFEFLLKLAYDVAAAEGLPREAVPRLFRHSSPHGNLILFSRHFMAEQPDFPQPATMCGFPFYDRLTGNDVSLEGELEDFLQAGEAPFVFTLGTSAVLDPGRFYDEAAEAVGRLGRRAVFLVGRANLASYQSAFASDRIFVTAYAPHSLLMPRGRATVHQGGVGTTAQAFRAGRPMVVVPFSHDQPDNARRCVRLGVAASISRHRLSARRLEEALRRTEGFSARAAELGQLIGAEDAVARACEKIEATQASPRSI
jgi:rhamnosyltransferase subunit B